MSVNIKRNGTLQKLADQTLIFNANSAETRSGAITVPAISDINGNQSVQVVFSVPMPDTNYEVIIDEGADTWAHLTATVTNKTTTGFTLMVVTLVPNMPQLNFHYTAFKLVTLEGYSSVQNKINNPDSSPTQNSTNLVTSGGVYEAIANSASSFIGTQEEWEALTVAQQSQYEIVYFTDDEAAVESVVVDEVTNGNMSPVTSNAVYDVIAGLTPVDAVTNGDMRPVTSNAVYDAITDTNPYHNWTILWTNDGYLDYESEYGDEHAFIAGRIMNNVAYLWIFDDAQNRDLTNVLPAAFRTTAGPFGFAYNSIMHFNVEAWRDGDAQGVLKIDAANGRVITQNQLGSYGSVVVSYPL